MDYDACVACDEIAKYSIMRTAKYLIYKFRDVIFDGCVNRYTFKYHIMSENERTSSCRDRKRKGEEKINW